MSRAAACPSPQVLERLLLGLLPEDEAIEEHLVRCDCCAQTMQSLKAEDTLIEVMRAGAIFAAEPWEDDTVESLVERLRGLRPVAATSTTHGPAPEQARSAHASEEMLVTTPPPDSRSAGEATLSRLVGESTAAAGQGLCDLLAPPQHPDEIGRLGPYRVLKVLGVGGMGIVFEAEDPNLKRLVAVKALLPARASSLSSQQRFLREARAAAAIEHDNIVHINQVGEDRGVPFLVMPLLRGEPLDERLKRETKLLAAEVLRIGREIAAGLAAAHERGLIHRDIKPANIWLEGSQARVKILDFGLARPASDHAHLTQAGVVVGTPAFMAPEQSRARAVDHRADLFSLGCILYRACTGEMPFKGSDTISTVAALVLDSPQPPHELNRDVPPALSNLIVQLLAKDPADRPPTAHAVAEALEAMSPQSTNRRTGTVGRRTNAVPGDQTGVLGLSGPRAGTPSSARPGRRRIPSAIVATLLLGALGIAGYQYGPAVYRIISNEGELVVEIDDPKVEAVLHQGGVTLHDRASDRKYDLKPGRHDLKAGTYEVQVAEAAGGLDFSTQEFTIKRGGRASVKVTMAHAPVARKAPTADGIGEIRRFEGHTAGVISVALSHDGRHILSGGRDRTVRLWDVETGKELRCCRGHHDEVWSVAFSRNGRQALSGGKDRTMRLWDVNTGKELHRFTGHGDTITTVAFSPDGRRALSCGFDLTVRLWDLETAKEVRCLRGHTSWIWGVAFSPDGRQALSSGGWDHYDSSMRLWDLDTGQEVRRFGSKAYALRSVAFSPDGRRALTGDGDVRLWDVKSGQELLYVAAHGSVCVAFSADGRRALSGGYGQTVHLWDATTGREIQRFAGHTDVVYGVAFCPDGRRAVSGSEDKTIRLWRLPVHPPARGDE